MSYSFENSTSEILVIDDDPQICEMIRDCLEQKNLNCRLANHVDEADRLIRENDFDVVISDICMPGKTGLDILQYINHLCPSTRTILMTGHRRSDWVQQALRNGAYDYIEKPFDMDRFYASVQQALQDCRVQAHELDPRRMVDRACTVLLNKAGTIQFVSDHFTRLFGMNPANALGLHFNDLLYQSSDKSSSPSDDIRFADLVDSTSVVKKENVGLRHNNGACVDCELEIHEIVLDEKGAVYHVQIIDLSPISPSQVSDLDKRVQLRDHVGHDHLTGLPNHRAFQDELLRLRCQCGRYDHSLAVTLLDINKFGEINAAYGYSTGDDLLVQIGQIIRKQVRLADYVARYACDEFAVIMPETDGYSATVLAERLCRKIAQHRFLVAGKEIQLSLSTGVVECQSGFIESQNELLNRAKDALIFSACQSEPRVILWGSSLGLGKTYDVDQPDPVSAKLSQRHTVDKQLRAAYMEMARSLVAAVEAKDPFTQKHSLNVANYAEQIARQFNLTEAEVEIIRCAATLHDVGKIGIPDAILTKPNQLTTQEFELIKEHSAIGAEILGKSAFFSSETLLVCHHHERYDGRGYPDGLAGEAIPFGSRIINVCDAVDCMFNIRSYKKGYNLDKVLSELERNRGSQFDPKIAQAMSELLTNHPEKIYYPG